MSENESAAIEEVVIVGSGPAGMTAAIYTGRANLRPLMFEGNIQAQPGGQLTITTDVENFPGFPKGIMGPALVAEMRAQAERFEARIESLNVAGADLSKRPFVVEIEDGRKIRTRTLIAATGAAARLMGLPGEMDFLKRFGGVSACATCDAPIYRNRPVVVVGGGDTAMEEAHHLTKFASSVLVIHRRDKLRASKIMQDRALKNPKIQFAWNSELTAIHDLAKEKVTGVTLRDTLTGATREVECAGVFYAIGHDPNTAFLGGQVKTDPNGFIVVESPTTRTSVPGVFACGDVMDPRYKQAITAAGTGCAAAIDAEKFLEDEAAKEA